jgi:hypothetical protein
MRFVLFVEGHTERAAVPAFLKRCIEPHLKQSVGFTTVKFEGWAQFEKEIAKKARMYLEGPSSGDIIAAIGLLDLYGPAIYPAKLKSAAERNDWGVKHFETMVRQPRFRMFFAHHETEAWMLGHPENLPDDVQKSLKGKAANAPETVNFDEPPSKLLEKLYRAKVGKEYKKVTYGRDLLARAEPARVLARCPYLKKMTDELITLSKQAGL